MTDVDESRGWPSGMEWLQDLLAVTSQQGAAAKEEVDRRLGMLSNQQRRVMEMRLGLGVAASGVQEHQQIATELGITVAEAVELERQALEIIRDR